MRFLIVEHQTGSIRQDTMVTSAASCLLHPLPTEWPSCRHILVGDDYVLPTENIYAGGGIELPDAGFFLAVDHMGTIHTLHAVLDAAHAAQLAPGHHYPGGCALVAITLDHARQIARDGLAAWAIDAQTGTPKNQRQQEDAS